MCQRKYEIRLVRRDRIGNPIPGRYLEYATDDAGDLAAWYERNAWRKPFKRKKKKKKGDKNVKPNAKKKSKGISSKNT